MTTTASTTGAADAAADAAGGEVVPAAGLRAHAYAPIWRIVAATLLGLSRASLPLILLLVVLATDPPVTPPILLRLVVVLALAPGLTAWLLGRALAARVEVRDGMLVVRRRGLTLEAPCDAIARVRPWTVPLPGPGLSLRMRSGRRLRYGLQADDPTRLLVALAAAGVACGRAAMHHPSVVYAHARQRVRAPWRWHQPVLKFVVFALLPTAVLFNAHQHIAYGGTFGQYYLMGPAAYLQTFVVYWTTVTIYLVLYASVWRGVGEAVALVAAHVAPARAAGVRRAVEVGCRVGYYAGVPVLLGLRFLP